MERGILIIGPRMGENMKYWMRSITEFGTMNDDGFVPNSTIITKYRWNGLTAALPVIEYKESDMEKLIKWAKKKGHIS